MSITTKNQKERVQEHNMTLQKQYVQFSKKITVGVLLASFSLAVIVLLLILFMDEAHTYTIDALLSILQTMTTFGGVTISGYMLNSLGEKVAHTVFNGGTVENEKDLDQSESSEDFS